MKHKEPIEGIESNRKKEIGGVHMPHSVEQHLGRVNEAVDRVKNTIQAALDTNFRVDSTEMTKHAEELLTLRSLASKTDANRQGTVINKIDKALHAIAQSTDQNDLQGARNTIKEAMGGAAVTAASGIKNIAQETTTVNAEKKKDIIV